MVKMNGNPVDEALRIRKFEVGDLVFAKLKGYPPWPAKINQIESIISGGKEKTRYNVYFYGTHQSSILRSGSLFHYDTYAKSIVDKWGRKPKFHEALKELEREMMDKITYLNQLRTTPDLQWCHGFNNACESLVNEIDGAQNKSKSKHHCKPSRRSSPVEDVVHEVEDEDEEDDESRRLGYEVMYMERIPFPDIPESLIVLSLNFNKEWVKEESQRIKEEERMKNCFVRIEPLPPPYAHLVATQNGASGFNTTFDEESQEQRPKRSSRLKERQDDWKLEPKEESEELVLPKQELKQEHNFIQDEASFFGIRGSASQPIHIKDVSDGSDEEAVETCPVCRLCFFSQADLRHHEKLVHGSVSTAESMFDRLMGGNKQRNNDDNTRIGVSF